MAEAQQRGMGRGLAAILPRSGKVEDGLREIPPDLIQPNARQPRRTFDQTRLAALADSIRTRGLLQPIVVRPLAGGGFELVAADRVIVPVQTEYFALEGLAQLLDTLSLIQRELNPRLTVLGMILTMHDGRTRLARDVEREVREHFPSLVFDTVVPRNVRLGEAPSFGLPVLRHAPQSAGSAAYLKLAKEVAARG